MNLRHIAQLFIVPSALTAVIVLTGCGSPSARDDSQHKQTETLSANLDPGKAVRVDLSQPDMISQTWVHRLDHFDFTVSPDGIVKCEMIGNDDDSSRKYGGIRIATGPVYAFQIDIQLDPSASVDNLFFDLTDGKRVGERLRWQTKPEHMAGKAGEIRRLTFVLDHTSPGFTYTAGDVRPADVEFLHIFVGLNEPGAKAGFEIHRLMVWPKP